MAGTFHVWHGRPKYDTFKMGPGAYGYGGYTNCKDASHAAHMRVHWLARNGWRGRIQVIAWDEDMRRANKVHSLVVDIGDDGPPPRDESCDGSVASVWSRMSKPSRDNYLVQS